MNSLSSVVSRAAALLTSATLAAAVVAAPAGAQKAIVYCPVGIDVTGCTNTVSALQGIFPGGVDRGYDGSSGTVDMRTADLWAYSVLVIPSLATTSSATPYTVLADTAMGTRLRNVILGRIVLWSGTPDQGSPNGTQKDTLMQGFARWARANYASVKGPGLVVMQDMSDSVSLRYSWMQPITGAPIVADSVLSSYPTVHGTTATGTGLLSNPGGLPIAYANMASYGFVTPSPTSGFTVDGAGQSGTMQIGQNVLLTSLGGNSGMAVITTDEDDYPPGSLVTITGSGFKPGETVTITLREIPKLDTHPNIVVVADGTGGFSDMSFSPDSADLNVRFIATATGATSGVRAVTTFTDAVGINSNATSLGVQSPAPVIQGSSATYTVSVVFNGNGGSCTVGLGVTSSLPAGATAAFSPATLTSSGASTQTSNLTITTSATTPAGSTPLTVRALGTGGTGNNCTSGNSAATASGTLAVSAPVIVTANTTIASNAAPSVFNQSVTFTATASPSSATGTMQFKDGAANIGSAVALSSGVATISTATLSVGSHTITAVYTPGSGFAAGTVTGLTQLVNKATATVTLGNLTPTYTGSPLAATATTVPSGLLVDLTYNGVATVPTNAGTYTVVGTVNDASYAGTASGSLVIAKANQAALSLGAVPALATYGSTFTVSPSGGSGTAPLVVAASGACTNAGNTVTMTSGTGTCALTLNRAGDTNYNAGTQVSASVNASQASLTPVLTAQNKVYDGTTSATVTGSVTGLVGTDAVTLGVAASSFADRNVGSGKTVTATGLTLSGAAAVNYVLSATTATTTASITPKALMVSAVGVDRIYDGTTTATVTLTDNRVSGDALATTYGSAAFADKHVGTGKTVSVSGITVGGADAGNYAFNATASTTASITAAPLAITASSPASVTYGAPAPAVTPSFAGFASGDAAGVVSGLACGTTYAVGSPVGAYPTTCSGGTAGDYAISYVAGSLHVTPAALTVTAADASRMYGDPNPTFAATYSGFVNGETSAVLGGTLAFATTAAAGSDVGSYPVTPSGLTATNYAVTFAAGHLTVTAAPLSVTANDKTRTYGAADPGFDGVITGIRNSDNISATYASTAVANSGVGSYPVTPTLVDPANRLPNYSVTSTNGHLVIAPASLTIAAHDAQRTYGAANPAFSAGYTGFVLGETASVLGGSLSISSSATPASNVGTYPIVPGGYTSSNYSITFQNGTLTVDPAPLSVAVSAVSREYGDPNPALTGTIIGIQNGDAISATYATTAIPTSDVGNYPITATLVDPGAKLGNYTVSNSAGQLTVTQAPLSVTPANASRLYGGADPAFTGAITGIKNADPISATYATAAVATSPVGTYNITATLHDPSSRLGNYAVSQNTGTLTIDKAPLTVTTNPSTKVYGDANPAFAASYAGFVNGETSTVLGGTLAFATTAVAGSSVGNYAVTPSGVASGNYAITFMDGVLTITQAPLSVSANSKTRLYGAANPPFDGTLNGIRNGDDITATYATAAIATTGIGTYAIVPTLVDPTSRLGNYSVTSTDGTLAITPATLTVTPNAKTKVYGAALPALDGVIAGFANGETPSVLTSQPSYATTATVSSGVGSYPISASGAAAANYVFTYGAAQLSVTAAPLSITANDGQRSYGASNPAFSVSYAGFVLGETPAALGGTLGITTAATPASSIGTYPIVPAGSTSANYAITFHNGTLTITPATLTIRAADASKIYGTPNPPFTASIVSGLANSDLITVTASSIANALSPVGTYPIVPAATGAALGNYTVVAQNGTLTITPWTFTGFYHPVDMTALNVVKGGSTVPLKFQVFAGPPGSPEVTDPAKVASIVAKGATCPGTTEVVTDTTAAPTGGTQLRYDGTQFIYNWKTPGTTGCYNLTVTMVGNSILSASFKLR